MTKYEQKLYDDNFKLKVLSTIDHGVGSTDHFLR